MTTRDVGDRINLQHLVYDSSGTLTNSTVVLTVTDPSGNVTTPTVSNTATGTYTASFTLSTAGVWSWVWTVSGTVVDVEYGSVFAASPAPGTYATLPELRSRVGISSNSDATEDAKLQDALLAASRGIEKICHRQFGLATTATARVFYPDGYCKTKIDDFWTTTGLVIATDTAGDGTYATTWASTDYQVEPLNGIVDGEQGWPYWVIRAVGSYRFPCVDSASLAPLRVTAKWGWSSVPAPVKEGCLILAEEIYSLKNTPFGVGGYGQFGIIRARENPMVYTRIAPYIHMPVLVG